MLCRDVMTPSVEMIEVHSSILQAAHKMRDLAIGSLPVYENDRLVGIITDRDIVTRGVANEKMPRDTSVGDVMTAGVTYCFEDQPVEEAARIMSEQQIRRLPILNRDKRLVGIMALGDLAVHARERMVGETTEEISKPAKPKR